VRSHTKNVADLANQVVVFDRDGRFKRSWPIDSAAERLDGPRGVDVTP
jgi:hypothetical protein